jgi:hypothetical protein
MERDFRFNLEEFAGAIGDYGTLLPIVLGVALVVDINLSVVFFFFALSYIVSGLYYKLPMPIEPMKAIGAISIGGNLSVNEIAATGIIMGVILITFGYFDIVKKIKDMIPAWLVRGIQMGLALILVNTSFTYLKDDLVLSLVSVLIIAIFYVLSIRDISALVVFLLGLTVGLINYGVPDVTLFSMPSLIIPSHIEFGHAFFTGVLPQLPLSLGNAILATTLLINDLLGRNVPERKLAYSMGLMCIISSPFGGFPMCHGAGGLAAQYRFGARTGGSNIISGVILLIIALFFASPEIINIIPIGVLGAMIFFTATQMFQSALKTDKKILMILTGIMSYLFNIAIAVLVMVILDILIKKFSSFDY